MRVFCLIALSTLLLSAQDRSVQQFRQPNGKLMGTVECTSNECKAYDTHRRLLGVYNKRTKETRRPDGKLVARFNILSALVYMRPSETHQRSR